MHPQVQTYWYELDCGFKQVAEVFEECVFEALSIFNRAQMKAYLDAARVLGKLGRARTRAWRHRARVDEGNACIASRNRFFPGPPQGLQVSHMVATFFKFDSCLRLPHMR